MSHAGPYRLLHALGRGGMGEVWAAEHTPTTTPVALKVLSPHITNAAPLRAEVEAAASLHHPHVVQVLDFAIAEDDAPPVRRGRPYVVMERVDGGTLQQRVGRLPWIDVRRALSEVLHALAFSHARGIIHRDVKPANVLIDGEGRAKLADFGLAFGLETGGASTTGGTPRYMAPEQRSGSWRDHGPWTDLHALGWLAVALVHGKPDRDLPRALAVPTGFDGWVDRLVDPDPARRFRRAADALHALGRLGAPATASTTPVRPDEVGADSLAWFGSEEDGGTLMPAPIDATDHATGDTLAPVTRAGEGALPTLVLPDDAEPSSEEPGPATEQVVGEGAATLQHVPRASAPAPVTRLLAPDRPPTPADWRRSPPLPFPRPMVGVGLGLVGLRTLPLVGRAAERDALWGGLRRAEAERRVVVRVVHGVSGVGKSRLVDWLCDRAHEIGAAIVLRAEHGPDGGPGHGLAAMLRRHFRVEGLGAAARRSRLARALGALGETATDAVDAFDGWLATEGDAAARHRFGGDRERFELLHHHLLALAERRPVLLWLDDVQWGPDALALAEHLARAASGPILVACTVRDDLIAEHAEASTGLRTLLHAAADPDARVGVGPLPREDHQALLRGLLGLDDALFADLEERTGGSPLFAVQLVGDWAQRGALVPTEGGFRLDARQVGRLPASLREVWSGRLDRALHGLDDPFPSAELAAVLGPLVDPRAWERACRAADVVPHREAIDALRRQRLLTVDRRGWHLVHGMLRETLIARAEAHGRLAAWHAAAAEALTHHAGPGRIGLHRLWAGQLATAVPRLLEGAKNAIDAGETAQVARLVDAATQALDRMGGPPAAMPEALVVLDLVRARLAQRRGRLTEASEASSRAYDRALAEDRVDLAVLATVIAARTTRQQGRADEAVAWLDRGHALRERTHSAWTRCVLDIATGVHHLRTGVLDDAERALLRAAAAVDEATLEGHPASPWYQQPAANVEENLAAVARLRGDHARMVEHLQRAREGYRTWRYPLGELSCLILLGEAHRLAGDDEAAIPCYEEAWRRMDALGSHFVAFPWINLALVRALRGEVAETAVLIDPLIAHLDRTGQRSLRGLALLVRLVLHVDRRDEEAFDADLVRARDDLASSRFVDPDVVRVADHVADLAEDAGDPARAAPLRSLAQQQRERLADGGTRV